MLKIANSMLKIASNHQRYIQKQIFSTRIADSFYRLVYNYGPIPCKSLFSLDAKVCNRSISEQLLIGTKVVTRSNLFCYTIIGVCFSFLLVALYVKGRAKAQPNTIKTDCTYYTQNPLWQLFDSNLFISLALGTITSTLIASNIIGIL